jgi:hypothetical protein
MPIALTIDQRQSRRRADQVDEWVGQLNHDFGDSLTLPFSGTVGDELQGLTDDPSIAVELVMLGARWEHWWVGIGLGTVELPLRTPSARSRGLAFYRARDAVEAAKRTAFGFAVNGGDDERSRDAEIALRLTAFVVSRRQRGQRSEPTWRAIEMKQRGSTNEQISWELGISAQAVGQRLRRAGYREEADGRQLATELLEQAHEAA